MDTKGALTSLLDSLKGHARHASGLAVPISGGSDGALVFWLCSQVYPEKTVGVHFGDSLRARGWFEETGRVVYPSLPMHELDPEAMRWAALASLCLRESRWPVGSRNRTEQSLGTYSRPSELATLLPIVGVWKTDVMKLCEAIGVPEEVLRSSRRADPECGRPKEVADIGLERVDTFLKSREGGLGADVLEDFSAPEIHFLEGLLLQNAFKKHLPHCGPSLDFR